MSAARTVILMGGGGHASVVADAVLARGWSVIGIVDDADSSSAKSRARQVKQSSEFRRLGSVADLNAVLKSQPRDVIVHAAVGDTALRQRWLAIIDELGACADPIVHPSAVISPSAVIDKGVFVGPLAVINAAARIGRGAIVNSGAIIEHDCVLSEFCHVAPGAVLAGNVTVGEASLIGAGAAVKPGIRIGASVTIGLGAAVVSDVPDGVTAVGVPAQWAGIAVR